MDSTHKNQGGTTMTQRPYFESVAAVYYRAACELYQLAADADYETVEPASFIARADKLNREAGETWTLTTRQQRRLAMLKARAELNTPEGRAFRQRIIDSVSGGN
jgi:hypothetical protein